MAFFLRSICVLGLQPPVTEFYTPLSCARGEVFEHEGQRYRNVEAMVLLPGGFEFRNPPTFLRREVPRAQAAEAEVGRLRVLPKHLRFNCQQG